MQAEVKTLQQQLIDNLIEAIDANKIGEVENIIYKNNNKIKDFVNQLNSQGLSPLYVACKKNNYDIAEYLLNQGASIRKRYITTEDPMGDGESPRYEYKLIRFGAEQLSILDELAKYPDTSIIEEIIQKELMVDKADVTGEAGETGENDTIMDDIYSKDAVGKTFFHHIFENNNPEILGVILKNFDLDANKTLDSKDNKGLTPLEYASPETMVTDKLEEGLARLERNRSFNLRILKFLNKNDEKSNILDLIGKKDITERDSDYEIFYDHFLGVNKNLLEQLKIFKIFSSISTALKNNLLSLNNIIKHTSSSPQKKQLSVKESTDKSIQREILESRDIFSLILPFLGRNVGRFFVDNLPKNTVENPSAKPGSKKGKEPEHT